MKRGNGAIKKPLSALLVSISPLTFQRHWDALASGLAESGGNGPFATALPLNSENFVSQVASARLNKEWAVLPPGSKAAELEYVS